LGSEAEDLFAERAKDMELRLKVAEGRSGNSFRKLDKIAVGPDEERRLPSPPAALSRDFVNDCRIVAGASRCS
jgi:hypothetical protein